MNSPPQRHMEEFTRLLKLTLSANNDERKEAESKLEGIAMETKVNLLMQVLLTQSEYQLLEIASIMLRNIVDTLGSPKQLGDQTITTLKNMLPQLSAQQQNVNLRNKYLAIISSLVILCSEDDQKRWQEINSFFYECLVLSNHEIGKEIGFKLLENSPCILEDFNDEYLGNIMKVLNECMSSDISVNRNLILSSVKAFVSLSIELPIKRLRKFVDTPIKIIFHLIANCSDEGFLSSLIQEVNVLVDCRVKILRNHVMVVVETLSGLLMSPNIGDELRIEALECIVTFSEQSPKTFKLKVKEFLPTLVDIFLRHITMVRDDPTWGYSVKDDGEEDENDIPTVAETSLDRVACAVGGKTMFPIIMDKVAPLLTSKIWQHRYAALIAISCTAEGCIKQLRPHLTKVVEAIVPFMKDENKRVVFACINTIGQLAVDYIGHFHTQFHQLAFPSIFYAAEAYVECPRVQAHAVCCFVNLLDGCPRSVVELYSDQFFTKLRSILLYSVTHLDSPGVPLIMENSLSSLSKLAETLNEDFKKHYRNIVNELITLVRRFSTTPHIKFYIASLDTLSSVLLAVGKQECSYELPGVLEVLRSFEIASIKPRDSHINYQLEYLEIMCKIAKVFGDSFSPVLPMLLPILLQLVGTPIDQQVISNTTDILRSGSKQNATTMSYSAHTDVLGDKHQACLILHSLCETLGTSVAGHVDQISDVMIKSIKESYDEDIISATCDIFPVLLKCAQSKGFNSVLQIWAKIFDCLYQRVKNGDEFFISDKAFSGIQACIEVVSYNGLTNEMSLKIVELMNIEIVRIVKECGDKISQNLLSDDVEENYDDNEEEIQDDDVEESILSSIQELYRLLFKMLKANFLPYLGHMFESIILLLDCQNKNMVCWGLAFITDLIEFCPQESASLAIRFLDAVKASMESDNSSVRQSACYLVAVMIEHSHQYYQSFIASILPILVKIANDTNSREDDNIGATANAVAAFGKVMKFCPAMLNPFDAAVSMYIGWLPINEDEVDFNLGYMLDLLETKFQLVAGTNNSQLPKVLNSIVSMIPFTDDANTKRSLSLLSQLKAHIPDFFDAWFKSLNKSLRENIESASHSVST